MKRKISWKTIFMMLLFGISSLVLLAVTFSSICLTYTGTVTFLATITLASYSGLYLYERYEKL